jgi:undecaprenyl-diphosphatase
MLVGVWAVLTGVLILWGEGINHSSAIASIDKSVTTFVVGHRTPALDRLMRAVTWAGSWIATLAVAVLVAALTWTRRLPGFAAIAVPAAWLGELLAVTLTKSVVRRTRPPEAVWLVVAHGWSFPSGHTANAVVVFAAGAAVVTAFVKPRAIRLLTWTLAVGLTALVGFSRIELGVHWMTDVVASTVWTTCWLLIGLRLLLRARPTDEGRSRAADWG